MQYLTIVHKVPDGQSAHAFVDQDSVSAMSWCHAILEKNALASAIKEAIESGRLPDDVLYRLEVALTSHEN